MESLTDDPELVECRICGKCFGSLGHHISRAHGMTADAYRDRFGILRSQPLTSPATRRRFAKAIQRTIDSGALDSHYATNADRAHTAAAEAKRVKQKLGGRYPKGATMARRAAILTAIVTAVEEGAPIATAVKRSPISNSTLWAWLKDFDALRERLDVAKAKRPVDIARAPTGRFTAGT